MVNSIKEHGFSAVPRDAKSLFSGKYNHKPVPVEIEDIPFPSTELVKKVQEYAKAKLRTETYNHSMRVYYYGKYWKSPSPNLQRANSPQVKQS